MLFKTTVRLSDHQAERIHRVSLTENRTVRVVTTSLIQRGLPFLDASSFVTPTALLARAQAVHLEDYEQAQVERAMRMFNRTKSEVLRASIEEGLKRTQIVDSRYSLASSTLC